ncbi:hypothetical protein EYF80_068405 [Liparis tanakae]|uniref:Uncharacterized protein n=1 Tax=Liparis tanakae TaxID=230148 RepID=A0A4Z2DY78_9TELE|nr:hypothetical protein EYF80_068405 [Liparis tanakae]
MSEPPLIQKKRAACFLPRSGNAERRVNNNNDDDEAGKSQSHAPLPPAGGGRRRGGTPEARRGAFVLRGRSETLVSFQVKMEISRKLQERRRNL